VNQKQEYNDQILRESRGSIYSNNSIIAKEAFLQQNITHEDVDVIVKVISYAPIVFRFIRALDKISEIEIMKSVKP
jgi:hypothetical protein|tara:strand:+ start:66 stop:293 length:228 start_codon:yes stop_codon:yes gene_type:complete